MQDKVQAVLGKVQPLLQMDGGSVELVEVKDGVVKIRLTGACRGCAMSATTIKWGIERMLKSEIPEIKEVVAVIEDEVQN